MSTGLSHLAQRSAKVKRGGSLVIPTHVAMGDGPFLDLHWLCDGLAECWARKAVGTLVGADPDQVAVEFDKHVLCRSTPPGFVLVDVAVPRRHEPRHFFWRTGIGDIENANAGIKPSDHDDRRIGCPRGQPTLRVMRTEAPPRKAEIRVRRIEGSGGAREEADDLGIPRVCHV